jgi:DNA gyrase subunit B
MENDEKKENPEFDSEGYLIYPYYVRRRPGMYFGDTDAQRLHQVFHDVFAVVMSYLLQGAVSRIDTVLHADGSLSISDNGVGLPTDINKQTGLSSLELFMTTFSGHRFVNGKLEIYKVFGHCTLGISAVNAVSSYMETTVKCGRVIQKIRYERGILTEPIQTIGTCNETGTTFHWLLDKEIFPTAFGINNQPLWDIERIVRCLQSVAYLNSQTTLTFTNERDGTATQIFHYPNGICTYVSTLAKDREPLPVDVIRGQGEYEGVMVDVAILFTKAETRTMLYVNSFYTSDGGAPVSGFRQGVSQVLQVLSELVPAQKTKRIFTLKDANAGVCGCISVQMENPQFNSQDKQRCTNSEAEIAVQKVTSEALKAHFGRHPEEGKLILDAMIG